MGCLLYVAAEQELAATHVVHIAGTAALQTPAPSIQQLAAVLHYSLSSPCVPLWIFLPALQALPAGATGKKDAS